MEEHDEANEAYPSPTKPLKTAEKSSSLAGNIDLNELKHGGNQKRVEKELEKQLKQMKTYPQTSSLTDLIQNINIQHQQGGTGESKHSEGPESGLKVKREERSNGGLLDIPEESDDSAQSPTSHLHPKHTQNPSFAPNQSAAFRPQETAGLERPESGETRRRENEKFEEDVDENDDVKQVSFKYNFTNPFQIDIRDLFELHQTGPSLTPVLYIYISLCIFECTSSRTPRFIS